MKNVLIIKHGALGDVVRTTYLLEPLKQRFPAARVTWVTKNAAAPLVEGHPLIDRVVRHEGPAKGPSIEAELCGNAWDWVLSLDDEAESNYFLPRLEIAKLSGTFGDGAGVTYTDDVAEWFDMGLLSKLGKPTADRLKVENTYGHAEIFARMLGLGPFRPSLHLDANPRGGTARTEHSRSGIGLNLSAGRRWPAKTLRFGEASELVRRLRRFAPERTVYLLGGPDDLAFNEKLLASNPHDPGLRLIEPGDLRRFAGFISGLSALVTSDSMALHLAIAQGVPSLSFFSATSACEIDTFGTGEKIRSTAPDYASYRPDADNSTITAERLMAPFARLLPRAPEARGLGA